MSMFHEMNCVLIVNNPDGLSLFEKDGTYEGGSVTIPPGIYHLELCKSLKEGSRSWRLGEGWYKIKGRTPEAGRTGKWFFVPCFQKNLQFRVTHFPRI